MIKTIFTLILLVVISLGFSQSEGVQVKNLEINTKLDHFAARVCGDKIYFWRKGM